MSYILDALKKLEHEKSRKNRGGGVVNITGELFEPEPSKQPGTSGIKIGAAVLFAIFVTFAVTWKLLSSQPTAPSVASQPVARVPKAPLPQAVVAPPQAVSLPEPTVTAPQPLKSTNSPLAAPVARPLPKPAATMTAQQQPTPAPVVSAAEVDAASILTQQELRRRLNERKAAVGLPSMAPPADIKLSGIAFQDERRARRAVVNGFLMQEGSTVSGATITDIYQDRVRFVQAGKSFELSLASTGAGSPGR